jgi:hypothetical protein
MKRLILIPALVLAFCFTTAIISCGGSGSETGSVTSIRLRYNDEPIANNTLTVDLSDSPLEFTAEVQTTGNASNDFTLSSSQTEVAAVSGKTVTLLTVGQTKITATASGDSAQKHTITLNVGTEYVTTTKPYYITNNFGEDASSELLVQWHNDSDVPTQTLQIVTEAGSFASAKNITVTGTAFAGSATLGSFAARNVFRAYVTGLSQNTRYKYRIGNSAAWSDEFYHTTSSKSAADFSFTVAADPQNDTHSAMVTTLKAANTFDNDNRFFLMCGDIVNQIGDRPAEIVSYTNAANELNKERPIAATQGNHDTYYTGGGDTYVFGEATVFNAFVTFPNNGWDTHAEKANRSQSYYFYYNKVLVIMLNTMATGNNTGTSSPNHTKQAEWLKNILENDRANNLSRYTIIATHVSPFGGRASERWLQPEVRAAYGKICADYGVDIFFAGHDHVYGRSNPIKIGASSALSAIDYSSTPGGTVYSIAGATGPKFYTFDPDAMRDQYFPNRSDSYSPGMYVNIKVTAEKLIVTAKKVDGTVVDTYEVAAK